MITRGQVEEWIREAKERPESAELIIRQIAQRLSELDDRNEALLSENIGLQSGEKVEEYENRISVLEYQLEMLKRRVGELPEASEVKDTLSLFVYDGGGRVLRVLLEPNALISGETVAHLKTIPSHPYPKLLFVDSKEELLFMFDSGRTTTIPVAEVHAVDGEALDWEEAILEKPRGGEELATILPIGMMALSDYCVQISRRGYTKKVRESFLETYIDKGNVGTGVLSSLDRTCSLVLCAEKDQLVVVSVNGSLVSIGVEDLPFAIQETFRLGSNDHVQAALLIQERPSFIAITQKGKVFHRRMDWLEPNETGKPQVRTILSKARRESGIRIVGAGGVAEDHWGSALLSDGRIVVYRIGEIINRGSLMEPDSDLEVLDFETFSLE